MRELWTICREDKIPDVGARLVLTEQPTEHADGSGHNDECAPYMAEVVKIGAHYSNQPLGESGYHVLCRELPDGERLARAHIAREEMQRLTGEENPSFSYCDKCGEATSDIDAGFSPGLHEMAHACGGTWRKG